MTRSVAAYMVILTMIGHLTLHDAVASYAASSKTKAEAVSNVMHGVILVLVISSASAASFSLFVQSSGYWSGDIRTALATVVLVLPFESLGLVFLSLINAVATFRNAAVFSVLSGLVTLILVAPASAQWGLNGWMFGRMLSAVMVCGVAAFLVRTFLARVGLQRRVFRDLFAFSRIQIISGLLSLTMLTSDVIVLERLSENQREVAIYGLAALFARSALFLPTVLSRVYFRDIADSSITVEERAARILKLLLWSAAVSAVISVAVFIVGPILIEELYGDRYVESIPLVKVMTIGIFLGSLWAAMSTVNVALKVPRNAVRVSAVGAAASIIFLSVLVPRWGALGAAWAMNGAWLTGVLLGLILLRKSHGMSDIRTHPYNSKTLSDEDAA